MAKLLLIEDVEALGRSGEVVNVKPGYARNFLLPQGLGVIADKQALRQQERLIEERQKKAAVDRGEAEAIAAHINGITVSTTVKVDHEGHMYGSVSAHEIVELLKPQFTLEKRNIALKHSIKATGVHAIPVKLKEGVTASFNLKVISEEGLMTEQGQNI